jgi:hypothetical protein
MQAATGVLWLTEQLGSASAIKREQLECSYDLEARNKVTMTQCRKPFQRMITACRRFVSEIRVR